jgi:excinuclease ABC subunit A
VLHDLEATAAACGMIAVRGAREHNLRNLSVDIPRGKFVVVTGVSGSGKSTLAFDLLFAEGQRRFLDSMSAYARQFVEQLSRPDVDVIAGLPPTVSIEQRNSRGGGKSTVATVTEIHHFIRLLFARLGTQHCPDCGVPVSAQTRDQLRASLEAEVRRRGPLTLLAPVIKNRKGFHSDIAEWAAQRGYRQLRADGVLFRADEPFRLDRFKEHDVEVVMGFLEKRGRAHSGTDEGAANMASQALVDEALTVGKGTLYALDRSGETTVHSTERACPRCSRSFAPLDPKNFSYNSSQGWCPKCRGFGELFYLPDVDRGANADAIEESWWSWQDGKREPCPECGGARLNSVARAVRLNVTGASGSRLVPRANPAGRPSAKAPPPSSGPTIDDLSAASVTQAAEFFRQLRLHGRAKLIARDILPEIRERLRFLGEVGLGYLQLGRSVPTLSGGENQRIRLAAQLGSNLSGVLYVLDEPTIGLHARDNEQLLDALTKLRERGNSLVVVEHDEDTMRRADFVIDLGPGAGVNGGTVVAAGTLAELALHPESITGQCLRSKPKHPARGGRRAVARDQSAGSRLTLHHATAHNLRDLTVSFPLGRFVVVTGVSGSGKSTLIKDCLLPALEAAMARKGRPSAKAHHSEAPAVTGLEAISAVHEVDQSPIGRTPRSTPATYVGFFDDIRALFAQIPEARMRGYTAGRFSFNSAQGRCPTCEGAGAVKLEMNFLPTAFLKCETCNGCRFNPETLDVEFNGRNIAQVLELSVAEAIEFFGAQPKIRRPLEALRDTGLDYLRLGQTSPTLSGGEAQRVKLVTHLLGGLKPAPDAGALRTARLKAGGAKLFVLEEPTIGLHISDVRRLVEVIQRLVDAGHTVIVIEHNLDLIAEADWVVDLGPEGGEGGGRIVAEGTPEEIARCRASHTGRHLKTVLRRR